MTERHEGLDELLDEIHPTVQICGITFHASDILFECDPIAYREAWLEYRDGRCKDGDHESEDGGELCDNCGVMIDLFDEGEAE